MASGTRRIVEQAQMRLSSSQGTCALAYLQRRGLRRDVIEEARLGHIPGHYMQRQVMEGIWVWARITIPWFIQDAVWALNVRRPLPGGVEEDKHKLIKGSRLIGGLYWIDRVRLGNSWMFVEGEFDCLLAWQIAANLVSPVMLGSATNRLHSRWYPQLISSPQILVLEDHDEAEEQMGQRLGKDVTDYCRQLDAASANMEILHRQRFSV